MKSLLTKLILVLFLLNVGWRANAQIGNEILSYVDSLELIMDNGKKILMESIINHDTEKTEQIYSYLQEEASKKQYAAFEYRDILVISLLSQNWNEWSNYTNHYNDKSRFPVYKSEYYISDRLFQILKERSDTIDSLSQTSSLEAAQKDLIGLFLYVVNEDQLDENYNKRIKNFKSSYAKAECFEFADNFLPAPKMEGSWGWGMGASPILFDGNLGKNIDPFFAGNMSMDFYINKWYFSLFFDAGSSSLSQDMAIRNMNFYTTDRFPFFQGGLQMGYTLFNNDHIKTSPYASILGSTITTDIYSEQQNELEFDIVNSFSCGLGLNTKIKLFEWEGIAYGYYGYMSPYPIEQSVSLRINVGYNLLVKHHYNDFKGNVLYAQLGLIWSMGDF